MGQNAEVMPRPLNSSIVIHSLEVRTIFSLFVLKNTCFVLRRLLLYFVRGGDLPVSVWDTRYPEHVAVRRSVNGGLVHVCFSVTLGHGSFYARELRLEIVLRF